MTSNRYLYSKYDINMAVLRYWGDKPLDLLDILHKDTPVGYYVFEGFHTEALSTGFDIVDEDGEIDPAWEDIITNRKDELNDIIDKYARGRAEANKTHALIGTFRFDDEQTTKRQFYYIDQRNITEMDIKEGTKEITKLIINNPSEEPKASKSQITITGEDLAAVRLLGEYDRMIGKFRCRYEDLVDNLLSLSIIDQQLTLLSIRAGSGTRIVKVLERLLSDSVARDKIEDTLENWGMNSLWVVPVSSLDDTEIQIELQFPEGAPPYDQETSRNQFLRGICLRLGLPQAWFNGENIGLRSSETNDTRAMRSFRLEQLAMESDLLWAIQLYFEVEFSNTSRIEWRPFVVPDERTQVELFKLKMDAFKTALDLSERAGMPLDYIKQELNLEYETDEAMIAKFEQSKELMQEGLNQGSDEGNMKQINADPKQLQKTPKQGNNSDKT